MATFESWSVPWADKLRQILESIDFEKGMLSTVNEVSNMHSSLMENMLLYHEYGSTVRPEINAQITDFIDLELGKLSQTAKKKSSIEAAKMREKGNDEYKKKDFDKALHFYTMSILHAPDKEANLEAGKSSNLALAYGNRSATFFEIGQWENALVDIEHAFEADYQAVEKLLLRKIDALIGLGMFSKAKEVLDDSRLKENSSLEAQLSTRRKTMEEALKKCKNTNETSSPPNDLPLFEILSILSTSAEHCYEPSARMPSLSSKLALKRSATKGRHLVAREPISPGDILAVELPYSCILLKAQELKYCHHCCRSLQIEEFEVPLESQNLGNKKANAERCDGKSMYSKPAVPCPSCTSILYCSSSCRSESWTLYHQFECAILPLLHEIGLGHLALRMLFVSGGGLSTAKEVVVKGDSNQLSLDQVKEPPYSAVYQLVQDSSADKKKKQLHMQIPYSITSGLLLQLAIRSGFLDVQSCNDQNDLHLAGALLQRHLLQLTLNAHAIDAYQNIRDAPDGGEQFYRDVPIASGLYPWISLLNHACEPNVVPTFELGRLFLLRASKPIEIGEEVVNSYSVHFAKMDVGKRQAFLASQFKCECNKCTLELKNGLDGRYIPLACESCRSLIVKAQTDSSIFHCSSCQKTVPLETMQQRYNLFTSEFEKADASFCSLTPDIKRLITAEMKIDDLQSMLARTDGKTGYISCRAQIELGRLIDILAYQYMLGNCPEEAARLIERSVAIVEATYGPTSIELVTELTKLVDLNTRMVKDILNNLKQRKASEKEESLLKLWKERQERLITLLGCFCLSSAVPPPLGDDSCYFAVERRRQLQLKKQFDVAFAQNEELREYGVKKMVDRSTSKLQQLLLSED